MACLLDAAAFRAGQYLTFRIAREDFAVEAERVRGILPLHEIANLREVQPGLLGVVWLGEREVRLVDLCGRLGLAESARGREPMIVVVERGSGELLGFVADRVSGLVEARHRHYSRGKLRAGGRPRRVLDPEALG